jgi:hypothetical protein
MGKVLDGGISPGPFERLMTGIRELQTAMFELQSEVAFEEHTSSLVDQTLIDDAKCSDITRARKAVEHSIGATIHVPGLIKVLSECSFALNTFRQDVTTLKEVFDPVTRAPTGAPGHC